MRHRRLDIIAIFYLLGTLTSILAIFLGGDARLLVIRESFFTGALGLVCLTSLLLPRPLMFYVGRQMFAGDDAAKVANFNAHLAQSARTFCASSDYYSLGLCLCRRVHCTSHSGLYVCHLTLAFGLGSTLLIVVTAATFIWMFAYIRYAQRHAAQVQAQQIV